jgi:hypothetical protein
MSVLIVGADGNMGNRYAAILKFLGKDYIGVDVRNSIDEVNSAAEKADGILIATPTESHCALIKRFLPYRVPILCEKPISKNMIEFKETMGEVRGSFVPFRMINQYRMLTDRNSVGRTVYDYFRHGGDGLYWDCIQIIGLARGEIRLGEESPVWRCMINGRALSLSHMDAAYIGYIQEWFKTPAQDLGIIYDAHEKTDALERACRNG